MEAGCSSAASALSTTNANLLPFVAGASGDGSVIDHRPDVKQCKRKKEFHFALLSYPLPTTLPLPRAALFAGGRAVHCLVVPHAVRFKVSFTHLRAGGCPEGCSWTAGGYLPLVKPSWCVVHPLLLLLCIQVGSKRQSEREHVRELGRLAPRGTQRTGWLRPRCTIACLQCAACSTAGAAGLPHQRHAGPRLPTHLGSPAARRAGRTGCWCLAGENLLPGAGSLLQAGPASWCALPAVGGEWILSECDAATLADTLLGMHCALSELVCGLAKPGSGKVPRHRWPPPGGGAACRAARAPRNNSEVLPVPILPTVYFTGRWVAGGGNPIGCRLV